MPGHKFEYGTLVKGIYVASLWFTMYIAWHYPDKLTYYVLGLAFLGVGLRPLIEKTGLHQVWQSLIGTIENKRYRKFDQKRRAAVERKERDQKFRGARAKDPKLPKNW